MFYISAFRGEVSFPGGMQEDSDASLVDTALRETEEELGLNASSIDVWSEANFIGTYSGKLYFLMFEICSLF
jgi:nudix motif 8